MAELFVAIRSGSKQASELDSFLDSTRADLAKRSSGIQQFFTDNINVSKKLKLDYDNQQLGFKFVGNTGDLPDIIQMNGTNNHVPKSRRREFALRLESLSMT